MVFIGDLDTYLGCRLFGHWDGQPVGLDVEYLPLLTF